MGQLIAQPKWTNEDARRCPVVGSGEVGRRRKSEAERAAHAVSTLGKVEEEPQMLQSRVRKPSGGSATRTTEVQKKRGMAGVCSSSVAMRQRDWPGFGTSGAVVDGSTRIQG